MSAVLYERWRTHADTTATALVLGDRTVSYGALHERVQRATGWLAAAGLRRGEVIALAMDKQIDGLVIALAALRLGATLLPLNERYTRTELALPLADAPARLAILPDDRAAHFAPIATPASHVAALVDASPPLDPPPTSPDDRALLLYTSGTSGRPKGVPLRAAAVEATIEVLHADWGWRRDDVLLHALPIYHVHGLIVAAFGALRAGAAQIWLPRFDARAVLDHLASGPATVFMGVPTFYQRLLDLDSTPDPSPAPGPTPPDLSRMRLLTSGSAGLPARVHARFAERHNARIVERYGMTEVGIVVGNPIDDPRAGSIGRPLPGVSVRIVGPDGNALPVGEIGELWVRAPSAMEGYHGLPDATAAAMKDGYVRTGDLGAFDADGRITLAGRRTELVITGGLNVYPAEVEAAIGALRGVREVAVYGRPDPDLGEVPCAAVVGEVDPEELRRALRETLAPYKIPRQIRIVDALPRNAMGKVVKAALRS